MNNNNNNIERFQEQIEKEISINEMGIGKATVRGCARLSGASQQALSKAFNLDNLGKSKLSTFLMEWGIELDNQSSFLSEGIGDIACSLIVKYYAFFAGRYCNDQAKQMDMAMSAVGVRKWMQELKGWQSPTPPETPQTYLEALKALVAKEEEKERLKLEKELLEIENQQLEGENERLSEEVDELFSHSSIIRIAKFNEVPETNFKWSKLKSAAIKLGLEVKKVDCPRFGKKNLYPHEAWKLVYPDAALPEPTTIVVKIVS